MSERFRGAGTGAGVIIAVIFVVRGVTLLRRELAPTRAAGQEDLDGGVAHELRVEGARWLALQPDSDSIEPALCADIGGGRLLFLVGQWLWEPGLYGDTDEAAEKARKEDAGEGYVNGLPPPFAFPTADFTLRRLPSSGTVTRIEIRSDYVTPAAGPAIAAKAGRYPDSAVTEGRLNRVEQALSDTLNPAN